MNTCCDCCMDTCGCNCFDFDWTNRISPRPFSILTGFIVGIETVIMGLTIAFLIVESGSDAFKTNCEYKVITHPIIMIGVTFINIIVSIYVCCYYNSDIKDPSVKKSNVYYLRKSSQLFCYKIPFCIYYVFVIAFLVFIIVGQLLLFNQSAACLSSFKVTFALDYTLVAIFLFLITFGIILICCAINVNSAEGSNWFYLIKFGLNLMTCGQCYKEEFKRLPKGDRDENPSVDLNVIMNRDSRGHLPESHYYTDDHVQIQRTAETKKQGIVGKMAQILNE